MRRAIEELAALDVRAIAVCLVFSFLDPTHEQRIRDMIHAIHPALLVSLSSEVDPAFREYERTCVTAFDAYIKPVVADYLANMEQGLARAGVARAVAGDAIARRTDVVVGGAATAGAAVSVRAGGGRGRRAGGGARGGILPMSSPWISAAPPATSR